MPNARDTYDDDRKLRIAIGHLLNYGMAWSTLVNVLSLTQGAQPVSNFRPGFALSLLRRYSKPGAVVLDTSTGYGGRLVAFLASNAKHYIGIDPATKTHEGNLALAADLCPKGKSVELIHEPAEDVDVERFKRVCDFAFTSPPYFSKERYTDEATQSWVRYETSDAWRDGFLVPMLRLQHASLKRGGTNIVNIADVKLKRETVPLVEWTTDAAIEIGFEIVEVETLPLTRRWGNFAGTPEDGVHHEPVIVMRKK